MKKRLHFRDEDHLYELYELEIRSIPGEHNIVASEMHIIYEDPIQPDCFKKRLALVSDRGHEKHITLLSHSGDLEHAAEIVRQTLEHVSIDAKVHNLEFIFDQRPSRE
jgi:hypothetical protein